MQIIFTINHHLSQTAETIYNKQTRLLHTITTNLLHLLMFFIGNIHHAAVAVFRVTTLSGKAFSMTFQDQPK